MQLLRDLSTVSDFEPNNGNLLELAQLIQAGHTYESALYEWTCMARSDASFYKTVHLLKRNYLDTAFNEKPKRNRVVKKRMECWSDYSTIKKLRIDDKEISALTLAKQVLKDAQHCGFTQIVRDLALELEYYYGGLNPHTRNYLHYRKIRKEAAKLHNQEEEAIALCSLLIFSYRKKKDLGPLQAEIESISKQKSGSTRFMLIRSTVLSVWHQVNGDFEKIAQSIYDTISFFEQSKTIQPVTTRTNLYYRLLPILIAQGKTDDAEIAFSRSISLPNKGSLTWSMLMLQKAYLGFHSGKINIAKDAYLRQANYQKKHGSALLDELWQIVRAYLAIFEATGEITMPGKQWRLNRFLNSVPHYSGEKARANVAILIAQFIHYLIRKEEKKYMSLAEGMPKYIRKHLRGKEHDRGKAILKMLWCIEDGDYKKLRVELRAARWKKKLKDNPLKMVSEAEMLPYEKVWEIAMGLIGRG